MTVTLTPGRVNSLKACCIQLLHKNRMTVREVVQVIGKIVASFVAVKYGPLYYRHLEKDKTRALKENKGDFDRKMTLSAQSKAELKWWINHVDSGYNDVCCNDPDVVVTSDTSLTGWGCVCEGVSSGGQ